MLNQCVHDSQVGWEALSHVVVTCRIVAHISRLQFCINVCNICLFLFKMFLFGFNTIDTFLKILVPTLSSRVCLVPFICTDKSTVFSGDSPL